MLLSLKYRFLLMIRNRVLLFWTLLFPLILSTFFGMVLKNAGDVETFQSIPIAVVENKNMGSLRQVLDDVQYKEHPLFQVQYAAETKANTLLKEGKVSAVIKAEDPLQILVNQNGIEQTITKTFFDEYIQKTALVKEALQLHPDGSTLSSLFSNTRTYVQEDAVENGDVVSVFFYTILAMNAMFAAYWSINSMYDIQANQSERAARMCASCMHKGKLLLADFLVDFCIHVCFLIIQFVYINQVFDVSFGNQFMYVFLILALGTLAGNAFGIFLGTLSSRIPLGGKTGILTGVTLLCSALAGMMVVQLKYYVQLYIPILAYINPVNMITDGLYSLYYYGVGERYYINLLSLVLFTVLLYAISLRSLSKKSYDHLGVR